MYVACRSRLPRARSYRIVVRGSAWEAASCTSRSGTPASSAAVMNAWRSVWGLTFLVIPARCATRRTIRPAPWRSSRRPSAVRKTGPSVRSDGQVDRPRGTGRQRDGDDLAALTGDGQRPVPALQARLLDVGAGGLRDAQPVQREQGDQRMLGRRAEPGGDQHGAGLVAVQGGGVRLAVQPRPPDVGGRGVRQELFFDGVLVEPGDSAQPPGDGGAGTTPGFQVAGEAFDIGAADGEQVQGAGAAPGRELAQVQGVGLAGQAAVSGQEPRERKSFGIGEGGLDGDEGSGWDGSGHRVPPGRAGTREAGPAAGPSN